MKALIVSVRDTVGLKVALDCWGGRAVGGPRHTAARRLGLRYRHPASRIPAPNTIAVRTVVRIDGPWATLPPYLRGRVFNLALLLT